MLTLELLKKDADLAKLDDSVLTKIATLSQNDENTVIATKTAEIWNSVDADIKSITGIEKPTGTKSYDHLKTTLTEYKTKAGGVKAFEDEITKLKGEKTELEKLIKDGKGDEAMKAKIGQLEKDIQDKDTTITKLRNDVTSTKTEFEKKLQEEANKNTDYRFDSVFAKALVGVKFKDGLDMDTVINPLIAQAKMATRATGKHEFMKDDQGNEFIGFRNAENQIITNPEDLQKPFTASGIFLKNLAGVIDGGVKGAGGGGGQKPPNPDSKLDLSGAKNRVEAVDAIGKHLAAKGLAAGTKEYADEQTKLYSENKIGEMPMS